MPPQSGSQPWWRLALLTKSGESDSLSDYRGVSVACHCLTQCVSIISLSDSVCRCHVTV